MIEVALFKRELEIEKERRRATEHRLHKIAENIPMAIAYHDRHGKIQFANHVFQDLVAHRGDPIGTSAMAFLGEDLYRHSYGARQNALAGEAAHVVVELTLQGAARQFEVAYLPDHDETGTVVGVYALGHDVTEREQLSAALRGAHAELVTILNAVPASITSWNLDLRNRFANTTARSQFGFRADQMTGVHMREIMGKRRFQQARPFIDQALQGDQVSAEQADDADDGNVRYTNSFFVPEIDEKGIAGLYALAFDITELRRSRDQIRQLARRLETVREEERRAVAVILHDGIAQDLFAMKLAIDHLAGRTKRRTAMTQAFEELRRSIAKCMDDTRTIANDLRPVGLDCFEIGAVIAQHARRFAARSNLKIHVVEGEALPPLGESARLLLFRAAQEALTNIAKHAMASTVDIALHMDGDQVVLSVTDDGVGIPAGFRRKPQSLGLLGLRERAEALGGELTLGPNAPKGTRLSLKLPGGTDAAARLQ